MAAEKNGLETQKVGKLNELETLQEELDLEVTKMEREIGNISTLNRAKRAVTVVEASIATLDGRKSIIDSSIIEAQQEIAQVDLDFRATASEERASVSADFKALTAEREALIDRQSRRFVTSPLDGVIIDLRFPSVGNVVPPTEALFDIVPEEKLWRVDVRFDPKDRSNLSEGLLVNLRFGTLDPIEPPEIKGLLERIDPDVTVDPSQQFSFYKAEVEIDQVDLKDLERFSLSPGIPVEVFLDSGVTVTPMKYFLEPLERILRRGMQN